ncbi:MAG: hypothetical protein U9O94_00505 [Nanoarchaeota archaeon]|nr:hypothetical protein [Nanoarchaeota archaeon]
MKQKKHKKSYGGWWFLLVVCTAYLIAGLINMDILASSLIFFFSIVKKIIWIFVLVFVLMVLVDYFIKPKRLAKYLGKNAGFKGWLISITAGIISTGAIYMWYPLLHELQKQEIRNAYIAAFLYNRAIKLPLLPLLIFYFGLTYTIVLTIVMVIVSVFQGIIVEKMVGVVRDE